MNKLKITQVNKNNLRKVSIVQGSKSYVTFGAAKTTTVTSIDGSVDPFQFVLEYNHQNWILRDLELASKQPEQQITKPTTFVFGNVTVLIEPALPILNLQEHLLQSSPKGEPGKSKKLVVLSSKRKVICTQVMEESEPFYISSGSTRELIETHANQNWFEARKNEYTVFSKSVCGQHLNDMTKINYEDLKSSFSKELAAILLFTFTIIASSLLVKQAVRETPISLPISYQPAAVVKTEYKKPMKSAARVQEMSPAAAKTAGSNSGASGKSAVGLRISQLLGKVSSVQARTQNIITVSKGQSAELGSSGRALAAIGKVESSGRNWQGESVGIDKGNLQIGGSGNQLGGGLKQGKTGQGGVGLIENESEIVGGLDKEIIAQYIKTQLGQILYCYERQLSASPDLYGKVSVKFTIAESGEVSTQSINDTTLKSQSVENCMLNKIAKWKFPAPKGGTHVQVTYPFLFKSTN